MTSRQITSTTLRIRRPNGEIELVTRPGYLNDSLIARMTVATREAGRGEILNASYNFDEHRNRRYSGSHLSSPRGCPSWTLDQGCPHHGELCTDPSFPRR